MSSSKCTWTEPQLEKIIGTLLRVGVMLAAVVMFGGGVLYLIRHGAISPDYRVFHGEPADLRRVSGIVTDALSLQSRGIMQLGLLLLVATPIARVAFCLFALPQQRDRTYVVTLIVFAVLLYSLVGEYL